GDLLRERGRDRGRGRAGLGRGALGRRGAGRALPGPHGAVADALHVPAAAQHALVAAGLRLPRPPAAFRPFFRPARARPPRPPSAFLGRLIRRADAPFGLRRAPSRSAITPRQRRSSRFRETLFRLAHKEPHAMNRRSAFTLIELLVVIAII